MLHARSTPGFRQRKLPASHQVSMPAGHCGTGDGRVYRIGYTGDDGEGGTRPQPIAPRVGA